jgi:hypothetical protein
MRLRSLFVPSVSIGAILDTVATAKPEGAVEKLYNWGRERLLSLAKGTATAAVTLLSTLIASAVKGEVRG